MFVRELDHETVTRKGATANERMEGKRRVVLKSLEGRRNAMQARKKHCKRKSTSETGATSVEFPIGEDGVNKGKSKKGC